MLYCEIDVAKDKHAVSCMDERALGGAVTMGLEAIGLYGLTEQMGNLKRKPLNILDCVFLEYGRLFLNVCLQLPRAVLQEAVSAQQIAEFDLQEPTNLLAGASRGRLRQKTTGKIQRQARQSVGIVFLTDTVHLKMYYLLAQLKQ